ncbi:MAG: Signal transduction response regulator [Promethearchaeota archaeon]|nr:MAG: Signal transduction response regulator [Candidatus Lokiarchaeota archaeon]
MKPTVLIVEDNEDLAFNLRLMLEANNFEVKLAFNGKEALRVLQEAEDLPEVVLSDIMMDEMDGYELFKKVYNNPEWINIPFIFLTALNDPEEIRRGKRLGVDDYLTKPFNEKDLLAILKGKIGKYRRQKELNKKLSPVLDELRKSQELHQEKRLELNEDHILVIMSWDDKIGPKLESIYPKEKEVSFSVEKIGINLFQSATLIYGQGHILNPEGILLNLENINQNAYAYFDSFPQEKKRAKQQQFMLALIAPNISYFDSLKIKEVFEDLSEQIKQQKNFAIKPFWEEITEIISFRN